MYKGLKSELEGVVSELKIGDGVVIEHGPRRSSMGYVGLKTDNYLGLIVGRHRSLGGKLLTWFLTQDFPYSSVESLRVVDPLEN